MVITVIEIIIIIITVTILVISIRILIMIMYILVIVNDSLVSHNTWHLSIIGQKVIVWDFPQLR